MEGNTTFAWTCAVVPPFNADAVRLSDSIADREYSPHEIANLAHRDMLRIATLVARARNAIRKSRRHGTSDVVRQPVPKLRPIA